MELQTLCRLLTQAHMSPEGRRTHAQAEVRLRQGDSKAGVAAYERAVAESSTESAALLSGLARALISDGRASVRLLGGPASAGDLGLWLAQRGLHCSGRRPEASCLP